MRQFSDQPQSKRHTCHLLMLLPVVEGSPSQNNGVVVGPFGGVAPGVLQRVPEVAPRRVSHNPLGEAPPHQEGKVHLRVQKFETRRDPFKDHFPVELGFLHVGAARFGAHGPRWSAGRCPRPGSAPLPSLWQREVGTDWLSGIGEKKRRR